MGKTKKSKTKRKKSRWTGSVFILGDKYKIPTKHTLLFTTFCSKSQVIFCKK